MYVGTKLFGVIGLFILPIGLSVWHSFRTAESVSGGGERGG